MTLLLQPLIVAVAPNGARRQQADHLAIPLQTNPIAEVASRCLEAGAAMIHLHVRDPEGGHTLDPDRFRSATRAIRKAVGNKLLIQMSSEAAGFHSAPEQMRAIRLVRPEAVSLALRELVPDEAAEKPAAAFFKWLSREEILTQYIIYHHDELSRFTSLCKRGIIPTTSPSLLFVIGNYDGTLPANADGLDLFLNQLKEDVTWMVCAFGSAEDAVLKRAAAFGGHLRTGFENQLALADGSVAADNSDLVLQAVNHAEATGRVIADADEARRLFGG